MSISKGELMQAFRGKLIGMRTTVNIDAIMDQLEYAWEESHPEVSQGLTFSVDGEPQAPQHVVIEKAKEVHFHNSPANVQIGAKRSKIEQIEENLQLLCSLGVPFERCSTYHVKIMAQGYAWNLYLSGKEKYHRDGFPCEGRGVNQFLDNILKLPNEDKT